MTAVPTILPHTDLSDLDHVSLAADRVMWLAADRVMWLAGQCPVCVPDGFGQECDRHYADWDHHISRTGDL